jgi:hypothetical protein
MAETNIVAPALSATPSERSLIGMQGKHIGSIHSYAQERPVVVEKERVNV